MMRSRGLAPSLPRRGNEACDWRARHMISDSQSSGEPARTGAKSTDRRSFLVTTGAIIGAGALLPRTRAGTGATRATWLASLTSAPSNADWQALRRKLSSHDLVRPGQGGYPQAKQLFDPRFDAREPTGSAYCRTAADVAACLSFASRFKLPVRARSGGHSYAGWSSVTGGLVLDVSQLSTFAVGNGTVRVGSGLDLIDLYNRLAARGLAVPGGSCPTVGIAGLAAGAGVGPGGHGGRQRADVQLQPLQRSVLGVPGRRRRQFRRGHRVHVPHAQTPAARLVLPVLAVVAGGQGGQCLAVLGSVCARRAVV